MDKDLLVTLYDHYKDTHRIIEESSRKRDRLMLFVILTLAFFTFQSIFPSLSETIVNKTLSTKLGIITEINLTLIGNTIWFLLLVLTLRYFQTAVYIERQYVYIHDLEEKLSKITGKGIITREGKSYLKEYPLFSNWTSLLYATIFPTLLLAISTTKMAHELIISCSIGWTLGGILNLIIYILLLVSIILYLIVIHKKKK